MNTPLPEKIDNTEQNNPLRKSDAGEAQPPEIYDLINNYLDHHMDDVSTKHPDSQTHEIIKTKEEPLEAITKSLAINDAFPELNTCGTQINPLGYHIENITKPEIKGKPMDTDNPIGSMSFKRSLDNPNLLVLESDVLLHNDLENEEKLLSETMVNPKTLLKDGDIIHYPNNCPTNLKEGDIICSEKSLESPLSPDGLDIKVTDCSINHLPEIEGENKIRIYQDYNLNAKTRELDEY